MSSATASKGRILLADDETFFAESLAERLRQEGYQCTPRGDGLQVAAELNTATYDILVADIRMPGNANLELIRLLPKLDDAVPAVLVTAYPERAASVDWSELPVISCLAKPVQFPELLEYVRRGVTHSTLFRCNRAMAQHLADFANEARAREQQMIRSCGREAIPPEPMATSVVGAVRGCLSDLNVMLDKLAANGAFEQADALRRKISASLHALE